MSDGNSIALMTLAEAVKHVEDITGKHPEELWLGEKSYKRIVNQLIAEGNFRGDVDGAYFDLILDGWAPVHLIRVVNVRCGPNELAAEQVRMSDVTIP